MYIYKTSRSKAIKQFNAYLFIVCDWGYLFLKASVTRVLTTMLRPVQDQSRGKIASRSHTSARQVLVIGNSGINKVGSREVIEHFHEPGSAVDDSSRCIHVFKSFWCFHN